MCTEEVYVHALQNVLGGYGWIADFYNSHALLCVPTSIHPDFILRLSVVSRIRKSIELIINHSYWFIYELIKKWTTEQHSRLKSLRSHLLSLVHVFLGIIPNSSCDTAWLWKPVCCLPPALQRRAALFLTAFTLRVLKFCSHVLRILSLFFL